MQMLTIWFLIFMSYSFAGWLMEVIVSIYFHHRLINRGFLIGPICPIYGVGGVLLSLLLRDTTNILEIFLIAIFGSAILEYSASYIMERLFRVRWWDYSEKKFNLNGRICLESLLAFGFIGILIVRVLTPTFLQVYANFNPALLYIIASLLLFVLLFDIALSLWLILGVRVTVGTVQKDATDEISKRVQEILAEKGKLNRRLIKAFPSQTPSKKSPKRRK